MIPKNGVQHTTMTDQPRVALCQCKKDNPKVTQKELGLRRNTTPKLPSQLSQALSSAHRAAPKDRQRQSQPETPSGC
jgi:hypothetical protein